jgi:hypothetical protein
MFFLLTYMVFRSACFKLSLVTGRRPLYLFESSVFSRSERSLRINSPRHSTKYMDDCALARRIRVWNSLPVFARSFSSLQDFKRVVREFLKISFSVFGWIIIILRFILNSPQLSLLFLSFIFLHIFLLFTSLFFKYFFYSEHSVNSLFLLL